MSELVTVATFRAWAGAGLNTVSDELIGLTLAESEAGLQADLGTDIAVIQVSDVAVALATGEVLRRTARLLARRNSPESVSGFGDLALITPSRDPDSARTLTAIRAALVLPEGVY